MSGKIQPKTHAIKITEATYKDVRSLVLESDILRVTILPDHGSKMASLLHKRTGELIQVLYPGSLVQQRSHL